jgi:preprotein translocase subunit SecY
MFKAFGNIAKIPDLRRKFLYTLGLLAICRIGTWVPLPGVDTAKIAEVIKQTTGEVGSGFMVLANIFSGGAMFRGTILALGIMPYISAAIVFQMLVAVVPALERIAKEGESGRRRINQLTRYAAVVLCIIQGYFIAARLVKNEFVIGNTTSFLALSILAMTAGTMFLVWMGEQIDEFGLGNGTSLIIMANILSRMPDAIINVAQRFTWTLGSGDPSLIGPERIAMLAALFVFMILAVVVITQAQRRVPMNHARRTREGFSHKSYLPLRVNVAGVIAIIFAQSVLMLPNFLGNIDNRWIQEIVAYFTPWKFFYVTLYMLMIVFFSYFYTAIVFNPVEQANQFKQHGAFIPGIRPGRKTAEYLEKIMNRITLAGAVFVAIIAVAPEIIASSLRVEQGIASFLGGTSLLITVGVALDFVQRIESHMMMQAYEGFMKGGKIRGRR